MRSGACAMASLVEARRDGRLGEREAASVARHLGTCAACRDLERELDEVRALLRQSSGPSPTLLDHQRGRLALLRAAAAPHAPPRPRWQRAAIAAVAIAAVCASSGGTAVWSSSGRLGRSSAPIAKHLPPVSLPRPERVRVETVIHGSPDARFEQRVDDKVERVALAEGTLELAVRALAPDERFLVTTDDAEVEVRGTVFAVEARARRIARVEVSEGKVEVRHRHAVSVIAAGGVWQPPLDEAATLAATAPAVLREGVATPKPPLLRAPKATTASSAAPRALAEAFHGGAANGPTPRAPTEPSGSRDASKAFGDAVDLLGRGDYAAARRQLDAFREAHPGDGRADLAAFLTIISLQRAGRRSEAQEAARRYLELYPSGDRRAEATLVAFGR